MAEDSVQRVPDRVFVGDLLQVTMTDSAVEIQLQTLDPQAMAASLRDVPGVYQMIGQHGKVLYVGKAKSLKKRVLSYFRSSGLNNRVLSMRNQVRQLQVTVTSSETEALLLEQNLIKQLHPPYNILLRDDKSFPMIHLSDEEFPRLTMYRGSRRIKGRFFGPYPSSSAVRDSLNFLHRAFRLRQCENSVFKNRSRPCLQYQIKRCSAPCVNYISSEDYALSVADATMFLAGNSRALLDDLATRMDSAAKAMEYELAAQLRDQIAALNHLQESQYIDGERGDVDIVAAAVGQFRACVQTLYVRDGRVLGSRSFFPELLLADSPGSILSAFLPRYYLNNPAEVPSKIIVSHPIPDSAVVCDAIATSCGKKIRILSRVREARAKWLRIAVETAKQNLSARLAGEQRIDLQFTVLEQQLKLPDTVERIECFDISHSSGKETVASCVVFDRNGPLKSDYRRYNIAGITPGDDFAALKQALLRRFGNQRSGQGKIPELLLIDGGHGQLTQAVEIWAELGLPEVLLMGVAKGPERKPGMEYLCLEGGEEIRLKRDSGALHLIQQIRDEAHRFAITAHRKQRSKRVQRSVLEDIPGIGAVRRRALLRHFGGMQRLVRASEEDLQKVTGISSQLAAQIRAAMSDGTGESQL